MSLFTPIFDRRGVLIAWLLDNAFAMGLNAKSLASVHPDGSVYSQEPASSPVLSNAICNRHRQHNVTTPNHVEMGQENSLQKNAENNELMSVDATCAVTHWYFGAFLGMPRWSPREMPKGGC